MNPESPADCQFRLASTWHKRGRLDNARQSYRRALELDPNHGRACLQFGRVLEETGRGDEAIGHYMQALERLPNEAEIHKALVNALERAGKPQVAFDFYQLEPVEPTGISGDHDPVLCCFACRNELARLPYFLEYYRGKGVGRFLAVDNDSDDGSTDFLKKQPDVDLWRSGMSFKKANFGSAWFEVLLRTHGRNQWSVIVDVDELLWYPDCEELGLPEYCSQLETDGKRVLTTVLLEMYSDKSVAETECIPGEDFRKLCGFFDRDFFHTRYDDAGPYKNQHYFFGGVRQRIFGASDAFCLSKVSLIKYNVDCVLAGGQHWTNLPASCISRDRGCLLHFKFFSDFDDKARVEATRKEHYGNAIQYRQYAERLERERELKPYDPALSIGLKDSHQLIDLGIMIRDQGVRAQPKWDEFEIPRIAPVTDDRSRPGWSVMITVYDRTDHLERCLRSVLSQAWHPTDMEIEVVADATTKEISSRVENLVRRVGGDRVSFFACPERQGHPHIFNTCINRARGHWIHILHDDDWLAPGFYARLEKGLQSATEVGAGFSRYLLLDRNGNETWASVREQEHPGVLNNWVERIGVYCRLAFSSVVVKRTVYESLGGFSPSVGSAFDWDMWKRIAVHYPVWYEPKPLTCCGRKGDSLTDELMQTGKQIADSLRSIELSEGYLPVSLAKPVSRKAREHYAGYAVDLAAKQLMDGHLQAALANLKQALLASRSPDIRDKVMHVLTRTET